MIEKTDIDGVRETIKCFLYLDLTPVTDLPMLVEHPIFDSWFYGYQNEIVDLHNEDALEKVRQNYSQMIDNCNDVGLLMRYVRSAYYLTFLKYTKDCLSIQDFSMLLGEAWTSEENPNMDVNVNRKQAVAWFRQADKLSLMSKEDYNVFKSLPEEIHVYRGVSKGRVAEGLSWTNNLDTAKWFANRWGTGYIQEADISKSNVLAYFNTRNEDELVVDVFNIEIRKVD